MTYLKWPTEDGGGPSVDLIEEVIDHELTPGESIDVAIKNATSQAAIQAKLYFFDKAGDLLTTTVPPGVDVIYRLGYMKRGDHEITRFRRKADAPTVAPTNNLAWEKDQAGVYFINDQPWIDIRTTGAKGGLREVTNGAMTAGSATFTSTGANFTTADIGKWVQVNGAGPLVNPSGGSVFTSYLTGRIGSIISVNAVGLIDFGVTPAPLLATNTVSGAVAAWGTDDTVAISNADRAGATLGRGAYVPADNFLTTGLIAGASGYDGLHLFGEGRVSRIVHGSNATDANGNVALLSFVGVMVLRTHLSVAAPVLGRTLTVLDPAFLGDNLSAEYIAIQDMAQPLYEETTDPGAPGAYQGEVNRIESVAGNVLTLYGALQEGYLTKSTTAPAAGDPDLRTRVHEIIPVRNISIHDICFDHLKPISTAGCAHITTARTLNFRARNVLFRNSNANAITGSYMIDGLVESCRFENLIQPVGSGTDGVTDLNGAYGVALSNGSWNTKIVNNTARRMRHTVTLFGHPTGIPTRNIYIQSCTGTEAPGPQFDTHAYCIGITYNDCHSIAPSADYQPLLGVGGYGLQIRAADSNVVNCSASGMDCGLMAAFAPRIKITGFQARNCRIGMSLWNARDAEVRNTRIINPVSGGIIVWRSTSATDSIQTLGNVILDEVTIIGNPTIPSTFDALRFDEPCGIQFGFWDSGGVFNDQWEDSFRVTNWHADDCVRPFKGGNHQALYGAVLDGVKAQNMRADDVAGTALAALTSGTIFFSEIQLIAGRRVEKLCTIFGSAGSGQTSLWMGLFDRRNLLAKTADAGAVAPTPGALTFGTLDRVHKANGGQHYIGICWTGSGTAPTVYGRALSVVAALPPFKAGNSNSGMTSSGSYPQISSATSVTPLDIDTSPITKKIVTQSGKAFTVGMRCKIASTASPTNYMLGRVTKYSGTSLWVVADAAAGSGNFAAWTITADAPAAALTATGNIAFVGIA